MIKPYSHAHSKINTMASIKPNSQTNKRSRTLVLVCLINSDTVTLI